MDGMLAWGQAAAWVPAVKQVLDNVAVAASVATHSNSLFYALAVVESSNGSSTVLFLRCCRLLLQVAAGSFSNLYRGYYCGQEVAVKILKEMQDDASQYQEFLQEVSIMRKVSRQQQRRQRSSKARQQRRQHCCTHLA
jgi:hypothetical protein